MQKNRRVQFAYVLAAIGGGLLIYGAIKWRELRHYSDKDIAASVELNLSLDVASLGQDHEPSSEQIETMRKSVRAEVEAEIAKDHEGVQNWFVAGAVMIVMALSQLLMQRFLGARGRTTPAS